MPTYRTYVEYDEDTQVWVTGASEVPGMVAENAAIDGLVRSVGDLAPDLLRQNLYRHVKPGDTMHAPPEVEHEVVVIHPGGTVQRHRLAPIKGL